MLVSRRSASEFRNPRKREDIKKEREKAHNRGRPCDCAQKETSSIGGEKKFKKELSKGRGGKKARGRRKG